MMKVNWIVINILPIFGFFLAVTLLVHQNRAQRSPASTVAWLLAILLIPYLGVPAYVIFGGRKIRRMIKNKTILGDDTKARGEGFIVQGIGSIFPPRVGNDISLIGEGEKAYAALIDLIEHAQKSIDITTFLFGNDATGASVLAALTRKAEQGVTVRLLLDALGSIHVSKKMLGPFLASGGRCAFFMPMMHLPFRGRANLRNHRKMIIVDNSTAIIGGMNIAMEYMRATPDTSIWHDLSLIVKGPVLADMHRVFRSDWQFAVKEDIEKELSPVPCRAGGTITLQLVPSGPDVTGDPVYDSILSALFKAQRRVWIVTPYFIPDEMVLKAICIAARRGVDVRIVVPRASNHMLADLVRRSFLRQVQDSGATICNFTPGMMHGKIVLVDATLCVAGSMNMDMRSFFLNFEVALFIYDESIVKEMEGWVMGLISHSNPGIKKSNIFLEFIEGIARLFAPLL
jgi:cardiolipin synthase A/B